MDRTLQPVSRTLFNGTRSYEHKKKKAFESSFSIGKKFLTLYRSCLFPKNVEATLCNKSWVYEFKGI